MAAEQDMVMRTGCSDRVWCGQGRRDWGGKYLEGMTSWSNGSGYSCQ